jgi:hypothetical protein
MYMSKATPKAVNLLAKRSGGSANLKFEKLVKGPLVLKRKAAQERMQKKFVSSAFRNAGGRAQVKRNRFAAASAQGAQKRVRFNGNPPTGTPPGGRRSPVKQSTAQLQAILNSRKAQSVRNKSRIAQKKKTEMNRQSQAAARKGNNPPRPFGSGNPVFEEETIVLGTPVGYEEQNYNQNPEGPCWSEKVVPMIAFYILICSLLFVTGALDPRKGVGLIMLIFNLVLLCMFAGVVLMRPTWIYVGGCD